MRRPGRLKVSCRPPRLSLQMACARRRREAGVGTHRLFPTLVCRSKLITALLGSSRLTDGAPATACNEYPHFASMTMRKCTLLGEIQ